MSGTLAMMLLIALGASSCSKGDYSGTVETISSGSIMTCACGKHVAKAPLQSLT